MLYVVTANIGISRDMDKRWITQYNSLFCVLNSDGQVLTWKLTPGVAFNNVEDQLLQLKSRFQCQGKILSEFFIDNCCAWRAKLQGVFGDNLKVYLDLFHAVKRISDKIPKRHSLRHECMKDLRMVFRGKYDRGVERGFATPAPDIMLEQMDKFIVTWKDAKADGVSVISRPCLKEIDNLKKHISKGCLSGIKAGRGTNRNEALHKNLNKVLKSSRYGIELAYALLTTLFFMHNENQNAIREKRIAKPIEMFSDLQQGTVQVLNEKFGLSLIQNREREPITSAPVNTLMSLDLRKSSYANIYKRIAEEKQSPVTRQHFGFISDEVDYIHLGDGITQNDHQFATDDGEDRTDITGSFLSLKMYCCRPLLCTTRIKTYQIAQGLQKSVGAYYPL